MSYWSYGVWKKLQRLYFLWLLEQEYHSLEMLPLDLAFRVLLMFDERMYIEKKNLDYLVLKFYL